MRKFFRKDNARLDNLANALSTLEKDLETPLEEQRPQRQTSASNTVENEVPTKVEERRKREVTATESTTPRKKSPERILARGEFRENDTWKTRLNNNDLIIGPSGAGKTRNYVKPNVMQANESFIVADTKGNLYKQLKPMLKEKGYDVLLIDLKNLSRSHGYNPFDFISYNYKQKRYSEQDIIAIADSLCPITSTKEPFWEQAAKQYITLLICYTLTLEKKDHTLDTMARLLPQINSSQFSATVSKVKQISPDGLLARIYDEVRNNFKAERTHQSILMIASEKLFGFNFDDCRAMFQNPRKVDFAKLGRKKTAIFLCISDYDRSMDRLTNLFYYQAIQVLMRTADESLGERLAVPVRFIFDDFATNTLIPKFDNIISVIRSREIYFSIILQSITQLDHLYGCNAAKTIINNCDTCLYLGGQDVETADFIARKSNIPMNKILEMPLHKAFLFTRGSSGKSVDLYDLKEHPSYHLLPESPQYQAKIKVEQEERLRGIDRKAN